MCKNFIDMEMKSQMNGKSIIQYKETFVSKHKLRAYKASVSTL